MFGDLGITFTSRLGLITSAGAGVGGNMPLIVDDGYRRVTRYVVSLFLALLLKVLPSAESHLCWAHI